MGPYRISKFIRRSYPGFIFLSFLISGCATTFPLEPNEDTRFLVVGQARLEASNFTNLDVSINGNHTNGIQLTIKNMNTGSAEVVQSSGESGLFYFKGTPGHRYQIKRVFFEEYGTGYSRSFLDEAFEESQFQLPVRTDEEGMVPSTVLTLGTLIWKADGLQGSQLIQKHSVLVWEGDQGVRSSSGAESSTSSQNSTALNRFTSDETQSVFSARYPTSLWNQSEWVQITFN